VANTYTLIDKAILSSSQSSVTFTSISADYTDLVLLCSYRGSFSAEYDQLRMAFNGTNNWSYKGVYASGSGTGSESGSGLSGGKVALGEGSSATANTFSSDMIYIPNYLSSDYKVVSSDTTGENDATTNFSGLYANVNASTSAVSSITLTTQNSSNFLQYSSFYLYGIKNS
jgi:hypothetical protein